MYSAYQNDEYLESKVLTAPPQQLHLMVLEAAIRFARQARVSIEEKQYETSHELLNRSREFVAELITSLNPEHSPEMVDSLRRLFTYVYRNLAYADLERSPQRIDSAVRILEHHRETWLQLLQTVSEAEVQEDTTPTDTIDCTDTFEWEG